MSDKLLEVSMMLGDAIKKLDALSASKSDPYAHLKEAHKNGEQLQMQVDGYGDWDDWLGDNCPTFGNPLDNWRIKPKEKKPEVFEGKSFYMKETGTAWVGVINGQEVTIVARGATGLDLYNCSLDDDEVDEVLKPYKYHYGRVQRIDSSMIEVECNETDDQRE